MYELEELAKKVAKYWHRYYQTGNVDDYKLAELVSRRFALAAEHLAK